MSRQPGTRDKISREEVMYSPGQISHYGFPQAGPERCWSGPTCGPHRDLHSLLSLLLAVRHGFDWHQQQPPATEWNRSQEGQGPGDSQITRVQWKRSLPSSDFSSFPEYKAEATCPSIHLLGLSWSGQCLKQTEIQIMASLVALTIWGWIHQRCLGTPERIDWVKTQ